MADKEVTVAVPEERVPEFYAWFAAFLAAEPGTPPPLGLRGRHGPRGFRHHGEATAWSAADADQAAWLYGKLAPPARELFDLLAEAPGERFGGEDIAKRLGLEKGAHGVAGILAWPGRYSRHVGRVLPIATDGRPDGGTDYYMDPDVADLFAGARQGPRTRSRGGRRRRSQR
ncbi:MAG: hypothetical protein JOZ98_21375 [Solirubrobacterales bacterium]|nr:hypothetical protein [Solirubrobacterales bacterium]MBV9799009.1 hypothetical protein [Solirubrobacterales bacterium]